MVVLLIHIEGKNVDFAEINQLFGTTSVNPAKA